MVLSPVRDRWPFCGEPGKDQKSPVLADVTLSLQPVDLSTRDLMEDPNDVTKKCREKLYLLDFNGML